MSRYLKAFIAVLFLLAPAAVPHAGVYSVIFDSDSTRVYYPRIMEVQYNGDANGTLFATCEEYIRQMPVHPIYRSTDKGKTWERYSEVRDTQHGWGMRYQPMLFELPKNVGKMKKGTILCAGSAIPMDMSVTSLDLYMSTDVGKTWTFVSNITTGGRAGTSGREDPVWEPFLMLDKKGRLVCFISDERDPEHNQKLNHYLSPDGGYTWGLAVDDVSLGRLRPGMVIISKLPNGQYFYTYEMVGMSGNPVHFKMSKDGDDFGDPKALGTRIQSRDGAVVGGTPYNVWAPFGGKNGMIIVTGLSPADPNGGDFFVNYNQGKGDWYRMKTPIRYTGSGAGYSRAMAVSADGKEIYSVVNLSNGKSSRLNLVFYRIPLEPTAGWYYKFTSGSGYRNLQVQNRSTTAGTAIIQADNNDSTTAGQSAAQEWLLEDAGDGYWRLTNANSGKVLEVANASTGDGAAIVQGDWANSDNQKWKLTYRDEGFYSITAKHSGKCLTVQNNTFLPETVIQQEPFKNTGGQRWRISPVNCDDPWK